jgi:SAM-dependent methyltransferase
MSGVLEGDPWLERWLPALKSQAACGPVLELGCGTGRDTRTLVGAGCSVTAVELSRASLILARVSVPRARFHCQDVRAAFPGSPPVYAAVVASLVLHYFPWSETVRLVERIRSTLIPGGMLLCRLNSTNDVHFGAQGHAQLEENYYSVNGQPKRFFSHASVVELFAGGWEVKQVEEKKIHRYAQPNGCGKSWQKVLPNPSGDAASSRASPGVTASPRSRRIFPRRMLG